MESNRSKEGSISIRSMSLFSDDGGCQGLDKQVMICRRDGRVVVWSETHTAPSSCTMDLDWSEDGEFWAENWAQ